MPSLACRLAPVAILLGAAHLSCSSFNTAAASFDGGEDAASPSDATVTRDAATSRDAALDGRVLDGSVMTVQDVLAPPLDANGDANADAGVDATLDAGDGATVDAGIDTGLDPLYDPPALDASACSPVGFGTPANCYLGDCLPISPDGGEGRCQGCSNQGGDCSGHAIDQCFAATDCDIGWLCYAGMCHLWCKLATPQTCGGQTCTNIGNDVMGVCF